MADWFVTMWLDEQRREMLASLTVADIERIWIERGDGSTLTELMEALYA